MDGPQWYDLDHRPIGIEKANALLASDARIIARDEVGPFTVSTVFLVLDHRMIGEGPPLLYETMVFDPADNLDDSPDFSGSPTRTATREAALAMHDQAIATARDYLGGLDSR